MTYMVNTNLFNKSKYKAHTFKVNTKIDYKCDSNSCTSGRTNQHLSLVFFFHFQAVQMIPFAAVFFFAIRLFETIL